MKKILLGVILVSMFGGLSAVKAQNGFAVWSKGGGCGRELHLSKITDGEKVGSAQLLIKKGPGADIWPVISPDGQWIAWSRSPKAFNGRYGECDYHNFGTWELYVAKIQMGTIVPAKPIHVANGYLPQWADDANKPDQPKGLYFTKYGDQTIQKVTINPDGSFSSPKQHSKCIKKMSGSNAHTQGSPDGKYIAYRPGGIKVQNVAEGKNVSGAGGGGCHPHWGPRSKYLIWSKNNVCRVDGMSGKGLGKAGAGSYFQGLSNDAYYDEGKLWIIARIGGSGQNGAGSVEFKEVDISNKGWKLGKSIKVGSGSACDIHMFNPNTGISSPRNKDISGNRISFTTQIKANAKGLQLVINSQKLAGYNAGLYNIQGKLITSVTMSGSSQNIIPLNDITNGKYILKVSNNEVSTQKSVWISR